MKLYYVRNDFLGYNYVHVLVVAESEQQARQLGSDALKAATDEHHNDASYWEPTGLRVEVILDDVSRPCASRPRD